MPFADGSLHALRKPEFDMQVPFSRAGIVGREREYMEQALSRGQIGGEGEFIERCEQLLRSMHGVEWALLTNSCTAALEMSAMLLGIDRGDEVIAPSFAFSSTVNAFMLRGARPVFVDIRPDTLNIDPDQLAAAINPRTRAIVLVHYAGVSCDLDAIMDVAARHDLPIVEDSAHGPGGEYRGRALGSFGRWSHCYRSERRSRPPFPQRDECPAGLWHSGE